jgi:TatD DNase family protein
MLVDSHCHLNMEPLASNLASIIERARSNDVKFLQTICTKRSDMKSILSILESHDCIFGSFGLHPSEACKDVSADEILSSCKLSSKITAIGETGLDYFYCAATKEVQRLSFLAHIEAAQRSGLPLVIHSREADKDMSDILCSEMKNSPFTAVLHCFTSGRELARTALDLGLFISISGIVTFPKALELQSMVASFLPIQSLLVETDSPYLAPVPYRGKSNEPSFVLHVAEKVASLKEMALEEVASITSKNFFSLFKAASE